PANAGTRFLMPSMGPLALALTSVLPAPVSIALVAAQGVGSVRPVLNTYNLRHDWMAPPYPWRAALRWQSEDDYLTEHFFDYRTSRMVASNTPQGARICVMGPFAWAYMGREPMVFWHSSDGTRIWNQLIFVQLSWTNPAVKTEWEWPGQKFSEARIAASPDVRVPQAGELPGPIRDLNWTAWSASHPFRMPLSTTANGLEAVIWPGNAAQLRLEVRREDGSWLDAPV